MQRGLIVRGFVASPSDVDDERKEAVDVIAEWNAANSLTRATIIEAVRIETHAQLAQGAHPQDIINGQLLDRCDFLIGIFKHKLGTPTEKDRSGNIQEINEFIEKKGPERVLLFFSGEPVPQNADHGQFAQLQDFKKEIRTKGLYREFKHVGDFARQLRNQLELVMNTVLATREAQAAIADDGPVTENLSREAAWLLMQASLNEQGEVVVYLTREGQHVSVGQKEFATLCDPRSEALWKGAVDELDAEGLLEGWRNHQGDGSNPGGLFCGQCWLVSVCSESGRMVGLIENRIAAVAVKGWCAAPLEIWARMTGVPDRKPQTIEAGHIEDWDAYGSHHEGMVTMIWWGETANAQAEAKYQELRQQGVLTDEEMAQKISEGQPKAN
jgi:hypothetical protein